MADTNKDTIYIDIDDEITAIIDKVNASAGKVVALVLPKRATTLQSIVNMKLLKRSADESKKNLVLITTESGLMPLAGAVGLHVAKTPNSRPEIPMGPAAMDDSEEQVDENADLLAEDEDAALPADAANRPVGELAGATMPLPPRPSSESGIETVELDNADEATKPVALSGAAAAAAKGPKAKKDKKLQVPNFDRFRILLILGGALLLVLIVGGYLALAVLPKATISIKTNASNVNTDVDFALSTAATNFSAASSTVPAKQAQVQKTLTGSAPATGQKNNGEKASGEVTFSSACANGVQTVPAGTGLSAGGQTYITQKTVTLSNGSGFGSSCKFSGSTTITAQAGGAKYNASENTKFTVSKSSSGSYDSSTISASGSASGGTDDIQTVISQADIDAAKGKISTTDNSAQEELKDQLEGQGLYAIVATFTPGTPATSNSSEVGSAASSVTVTQNITYTMLGAKEADLKTLVDNDIKSQIDTKNQGILTQGITQGSFKLKEANATGAKMNIQTVAEVGPSISTTDIAKNAAGKKSNEIKSDVSSNPDVTEVTVKMSPFWVNKAPKNVNKITVTVAKPTKTANAD